MLSLKKYNNQLGELCKSVDRSYGRKELAKKLNVKMSRATDLEHLLMAPKGRLGNKVSVKAPLNIRNITFIRLVLLRCYGIELTKQRKLAIGCMVSYN